MGHNTRSVRTDGQKHGAHCFLFLLCKKPEASNYLLLMCH